MYLGPFPKLNKKIYLFFYFEKKGIKMYDKTSSKLII